MVLPVRRFEICELVLGLLAEVSAVDQEEDALRAGEFEQAIRDIDRREGLPGTGRHLNQGTGVATREGRLEITDRAGLHTPEPRFIESGELAQTLSQLCCLSHAFRQRLRSGKVEDFAAARHRIETVGEVSDCAIGFEQKGQWTPVGRQIVGQTGSVFRGLRFDTGQRAFRLRLDCADRLAVDVEQIIGETETRLHRELTDSDPAARLTVTL